MTRTPRGDFCGGTYTRAISRETQQTPTTQSYWLTKLLAPLGGTVPACYTFGKQRAEGLAMGSGAYSVGWLRLIRLLTQYIVPGLAAVVMLGEVLSAPVAGSPLSGYAMVYNYLLLVAFTLATVMMIAVCGWTVFLWDIDRLFFTLDSRIDTEIGELEKKSPDREQDGSLLGRAREMLSNAVQTVRGRSVALIEKAYWDDINAGGVLSFPHPDIAAAVEQIDKSRRDLLAPLTELVASAIPLGNLPARIVSRLIFRYVAHEVKVRLYRRLVLRFLSQLSALFALTAVCFYISILAWSRVDGSAFAPASVSPASVLMYQLDLMLRGALFDVMEHTHRSVSPIAINQDATAFVYYTLLFRMFVAVYVISSVFRVARFMFRRRWLLLRR